MLRFEATSYKFNFNTNIFILQVLHPMTLTYEYICSPVTPIRRIYCQRISRFCLYTHLQKNHFILVFSHLRITMNLFLIMVSPGLLLLSNLKWLHSRKEHQQKQAKKYISTQVTRIFPIQSRRYIVKRLQPRLNYMPHNRKHGNKKNFLRWHGDCKESEGSKDQRLISYNLARFCYELFPKYCRYNEHPHYPPSYQPTFGKFRNVRISLTEIIIIFSRVKGGVFFDTKTS